MRIRIQKALLIAGVMAGMMGCTNTSSLFSENDPYNKKRLEKYWGADSAKEARESRQRAQEMGFGFATGAGAQ